MKTTRRAGLLSVLLLATLMSVFTFPAVTAQAAITEDNSKIVTVGQAEFLVVPDVATVVVGVSALEDTAVKAQSAVATHMSELKKTLLRLGVAEQLIQTRTFNVGPEYEYNDGKRNLVGYRASHDLHIKLENLARMGEVLDAIVAAGASEVRNVQFGLKDDRAVLRQALEEAVRDARLKADALAGGAGAKVTRVVRIHDQSSNNVVIPMERGGFNLMAAKADQGTQIAMGEISVKANVEVEFEFK